MKKAAVFLALALIAAPAAAQTTTAAAQASANLQNMVGQSFAGDLKLVAVRSEGAMLILTVDGTTGWGTYPRDHAINGFLNGFCKNPNATAFFQTSTVRVDTLEKGKDLQKGPVAHQCPATAPATGQN